MFKWTLNTPLKLAEYNLKIYSTLFKWKKIMFKLIFTSLSAIDLLYILQKLVSNIKHNEVCS